jgi:putative ABC transport system permease protein
MMLKHRGFTVVVLLTMALGIGANVAIFSVVNNTLLSTLPYKEPDRLVYVWSKLARGNQNRSTVSLPDYKDWTSQAQAFEASSCYTYNLYNLVGAQDPEQVRGAQVSADFFNVLGVEPALGRSFRAEEERDPLVILSDGLWQRRYGSDRNIVGQSVVMNGENYTVVGVMPQGFRFPSNEVQLWTTFATIHAEGPTLTGNRKARNYRVIARLKPGATVETAQTEMNTVARRLEQQYPDTNGGVGANVITMHEQLVGDVRPTLLVLQGVVAFVLLIACANVANLMLARTSSREREMAIRTTLGATRSRMVRQLLTESVLLSLIGGGLGLLLALWGVTALVGLGLNSLVPVEAIHLDARLLIFAALVSLVTGIIFGLAPALQASKLNLNEMLKEGGRGTAGSARARRAQALLVITEVALTMVLLVGAGLMLRSFMYLLEVNPGFKPDNLMTLHVAVPQKKYAEGERLNALYDQVRERVGGLPGVSAVAIAESRPPGGLQRNLDFLIHGQPDAAGGQSLRAASVTVSDNYFSTLGVPLVKGRYFGPADKKGAPEVAVISETMARRFFAGAEAVGQRIKLASAKADAPWFTIVGVVADVKYRGLDADAGPTMYFSAQQTPPPGAYLLIRTTTEPTSIVPSVRGAIRSLDAELPLSNIKTMQQLLDESVSQSRFAAVLIGIFAVVALVLASVGIYGVISYSISQRTGEVGIRMALGAQTNHILRLFVSQGVRLALLGIGIGLLGAFAMSRIITSLLYQVSAIDPLTYVGTALVLAFVAVAASYIPARRATRVHPMIALRQQ